MGKGSQPRASIMAGLAIEFHLATPPSLHLGKGKVGRGLRPQIDGVLAITRQLLHPCHHIKIQLVDRQPG